MFDSGEVKTDAREYIYRKKNTELIFSWFGIIYLEAWQKLPIGD